MEYAVQYLIAYCLGMIPSFFYNVGAGILRAVGDTKRPLYFLIVACLVNIVLDIVFVAVMGMGALGAGLATMISQWVSAALVYISLSGTSAIYRLDKTQLGLHQASLSRVLQVGIPGGHSGQHVRHFQRDSAKLHQLLRHRYGGSLDQLFQGGRLFLDGQRRLRHRHHHLRGPELWRRAVQPGAKECACLPCHVRGHRGCHERIYGQLLGHFCACSPRMRQCWRSVP